jgi:hypothetical protein
MIVRRGLRVVTGPPWFEVRGKECIGILLRKEKRHRHSLAQRQPPAGVMIESAKIEENVRP